MRPGRLAIMLLTLMACGSDAPTVCPALPCPLGLAIVLTLTGSPAGTPVTTASVALPNVTPALPCNFGALRNECWIPGGMGSYTFTVAAQFYEPVTRTVRVTEHREGCNCPAPDTQRLSIAMSPTS